MATGLDSFAHTAALRQVAPAAPPPTASLPGAPPTVIAAVPARWPLAAMPARWSLGAMRARWPLMLVWILSHRPSATLAVQAG